MAVASARRIQQVGHEQVNVVDWGALHWYGRKHTPMQLQVGFLSHAAGLDTQW